MSDDAFDLGSLSKRIQEINSKDDDEYEVLLDNFHKRLKRENHDVREMAQDLLDRFNRPWDIINDPKKIEEIISYSYKRSREDDAFLNKMEPLEESEEE